MIKKGCILWHVVSLKLKFSRLSDAIYDVFTMTDFIRYHPEIHILKNSGFFESAIFNLIFRFFSFFVFVIPMIASHSLLVSKDKSKF